MAETINDFRLPRPLFLVALGCIAAGIGASTMFDIAALDWYSIWVDAANWTAVFTTLLLLGQRRIDANFALAVLGISCCLNLLLEVVQSLLFNRNNIDNSVLVFSCISLAFMGGLSLIVDKRFAIVFGVGIIMAIGAAFLIEAGAILRFWVPVLVVSTIGCALVFYLFRLRLERLMAEIRVAQRRLGAQEKLAFMGTMASGVAHEIRNPLNFMTNFAQSSAELLLDLEKIIQPLAEALPSKGQDNVAWLLRTLMENMHDMQDCGYRGEAVVRSMLQHAREEPPEFADCSLLEQADRALQLALQTFRIRNPGLQCKVNLVKPDHDIRAIAVHTDICRALTNVCLNAFQALGERAAREGQAFAAELTISLELIKDTCRMCIQDNGGGIDEQLQAYLFEPFHARKGIGKGSGLGLYFSHEIVVVEHGGKMTVTSRPGQGTMVNIEIPESRAEES